MGQVPIIKNTAYLFVGNGRLSKHFQFYFKSLNIPHLVWSRNSKKNFNDLAKQVEKILVLIKDDEIEKFISENKSVHLNDKLFIHFSGLLSTPLAESAHPLMTFGDNLYEQNLYQQITFITEFGRKSFKELFPELPNPSFKINSEQKPLYHAFCVMSGNFTTILWQRFFDYLNSLNIPKQAGYLYLQKIAENVITSNSPLTGPIHRNDSQTINKHLIALEEHSMKNIYKSFLELFYTESKEK